MRAAAGTDVGEAYIDLNQIGTNGFDFSKLKPYFIGGDDNLLNDKKTARIYGICRSKLWSGVKSGEFPPGTSVGSRSTRWSNNISQADIRRRLAENMCGKAA